MSETDQTPERGRFLWYQLMTRNPSQAREFYSRVLGWTPEDREMDGEAYTEWSVGGVPQAGIMAMPPDAEAPAHWLGYVSVSDVDEAAGRAEELGGKVLVPATDLEGVGRFAVLADPQGGTLGIYRPGAGGEEMIGPEAEAQPGQFSWHELMTTDADAAFAFYGELFGWETHEEMDMGDLGIYRIYGRPGGIPLGGMMTQPEDMPVPLFWIYYIRVENLDEAVQRVEEQGGRVVNGPMEVPDGGRIAQCIDPEGTFFALHWGA